MKGKPFGESWFFDVLHMNEKGLAYFIQNLGSDSKGATIILSKLNPLDYRYA